MNTYKPKWQKMYSDVYPDNSAMRVESETVLRLTKLTIIGTTGAEVCFVFAENQAFQAAYALLKSINTIGHAELVERAKTYESQGS